MPILASQKIAIAEKSLAFSNHKVQIASFTAEIARKNRCDFGGCGIKSRSVSALSKSQHFRAAKAYFNQIPCNYRTTSWWSQSPRNLHSHRRRCSLAFCSEAARSPACNRGRLPLCSVALGRSRSSATPAQSHGHIRSRPSNRPHGSANRGS